MKIKHKLMLIILILALLISTFSNTSYAETYTSSQNPSLYSEAAILIDAKTGKTLYGKNENEKKFPASTTKILTAIIILEKCNLTDKATASYNAVMSIPSGYSNAAIKPNDTLSIQDLLNVFLIHSANEAGFILAEHVSGSITAFADLMNEKAQQIGCKNTHFTNPSGIHDDDHYSTAYDMALIAKYCMENDTFRKIISTTSCSIPSADGSVQKFPNTNSLIIDSSKYYYKYAIGIKTGYTSQAKNCLIAASSKNNLELITVVLGASQTEDNKSARYVDTINLFNYGYDNYKAEEILAQNKIVDEIVIKNATKDTKNLQILAKEQINATIPTNTNIESLDYSIELNKDLSAPIPEGLVVGKINYNIDGFTYSTDLIAKNDVIKSDMITLITQIVLAIFLLFVLSKLLSRKKLK